MSAEDRSTCSGWFPESWQEKSNAPFKDDLQTLGLNKISKQNLNIRFSFSFAEQNP